MHEITLLVADDEAIDRAFIKAVVRNEHLPVAQVLEADNGQEAILLCLRHKPALILLDIHMPGCDGLRAAREILAANQNAHIVIVSAYNDFEYARTAFRSGVADYWTKPVRVAEIAELVKQVAAADEAVTDNPAGGSEPPFILNAKQYIAANITEPLQLEDVAAAVFVSPHYLSRTFKKITGKSLIGYIQEVRLGKAQRLLVETGQSVTEIAARVGFNDAAYFATCFRKSLGITPLHYRMLNKAQDV